MRRLALVLLACATPLLLAACHSRVFRTEPPMKSMVVTETCTPIPHPHGP